MRKVVHEVRVDGKELSLRLTMLEVLAINICIEKAHEALDKIICSELLKGMENEISDISKASLVLEGIVRCDTGLPGIDTILVSLANADLSDKDLKGV